MNKKTENRFDRRFFGNYYEVTDCPSFDAMTAEGKLLVLLVAKFYNSEKKEAVPLSVRIVARLLSIKYLKKARRVIEEVISHGFLCKVSEGYLGSHGKGIAATYRFTAEKYKGEPVTRDYLSWSGTESRVSGIHRPVYERYTPRVSGIHRPRKKSNKNGVPDSAGPVYQPYTHLEANHSTACDAGIGHNQGPPLEDPEPVCPEPVYPNDPRLDGDDE